MNRSPSPLVCLGVAAWLIALPVHAQNWPAFRGPNATGLGSGTPPVSWDVKANRNIAWKTAIPGMGHSSPIVWGRARGWHPGEIW